MWDFLAHTEQDQRDAGRLSWTWPVLCGVVGGILLGLTGGSLTGWFESGAVWAYVVLCFGAFLCLQNRRPAGLLLLLLGGTLGWGSQHIVNGRPNVMTPWIGAKVTLNGYWDGQFLNLNDPKARVALAPKPAQGVGNMSVSGRLITPNTRRIPGGFDQRAWLSTQGGLFMPTPQSVLVGATVKQHRAVGGLRGWFRTGLTAGLSQRHAALMQAIGTGDRNELDRENFTESYRVRDAFARAGLAHLMALSGQNVALITGCFIWLLGLAGATPLLRFGLPALLLVPYLFVLVNISPSITRAVVMGMAVMLALMIGRGKLQLLDVLAFAAIVCLLFFPMWLLDIGFQLSFIAVLALNYSRQLAERLPNAWPQWLRLGLAATLLAQLATLPIIAHHFGQIPLFGSLAANLLAAPLMAILVPLSFIAGLLGPLAILINWLVAPLATLLLVLADFFGRFAPLAWGSISPAGFVAYAVFALAGVWWLVGRIRGKILLGSTLVLMVLSFLPSLVPKSEIVFLDVGQGDATLLRLSGTEILIDGGGSIMSDYDVGAGVVLPALRALGVRKLDVVVATHADTDHIEGLVSVLEHLPVGELWIGHRKPDDLLLSQLLGQAEDKRVPVREIRRGDQIEAGGATLKVLWPKGGIWSSSDNDNSVALRLETDKMRAAFLGDLSLAPENYIGVGPVDVLKAGHHGSRFSTGAGFLATTRPHDVVISVGRNVYGHPHPDVLRRVANVGGRTWRTDTFGTIRWPLQH